MQWSCPLEFCGKGLQPGHNMVSVPPGAATPVPCTSVPGAMHVVVVVVVVAAAAPAADAPAPASAAVAAIAAVEVNAVAVASAAVAYDPPPPVSPVDVALAVALWYCPPAVLAAEPPCAAARVPGALPPLDVEPPAYAFKKQATAAPLRASIVPPFDDVEKASHPEGAVKSLVHFQWRHCRC